MKFLENIVGLFDKRLRFWLIFVGTTLLLVLTPPIGVIGAPGDVVNCSSPLNLSNSLGYSSIDPFLVADPAGVVHLFWAERVTGEPGSGFGGPDAVMYAAWNGETWSEPVDIFLSPPDYFNRFIGAIRGVIDDQGKIHLMWTGPDNTFFYSSVHASKAASAYAWQTPVLLSEDLTGVQYGFDLAYEPPQTLHVVFGKGTPNENVPRSISYIRSMDNGLTWSETVELFPIPDIERGASNIRLLADQPNRLYATWTEWDTTGNGQAIYFIRSLDDGDTWDSPILLDERTGIDYERDWTNTAVLDENQLIVMWEGGFRAYPQAQYSDDGGVTWSDPIDTFYWLIADNGYANLIRDSAGQLHAFLVRRVREGSGAVCRFSGCATADTTNTLWHSVWEGGRDWREPQPVSDFVFNLGAGMLGELGGNFTSVAVSRGNQLITAWFDYTYFELIVMQCEIEGASAIAPQIWPTATLNPSALPQPTTLAIAVLAEPTQIPTRTNMSTDIAMTSSKFSSNPATPMLLATMTILVLVLSVAFYNKIRNRNL